jgi:SAM-dependent methyltransferase
MLKRAYDATWGRAFALGYDRLLAPSEEAGLGEERRKLLAQASGRTLEIGAGTGVNLQHYPPAVSELLLTEPFGPMFAQLREKASASGRPAEVIQAPGESLPLADHSFDTVVLTLVLCTTPDPQAVLREVARVLRPGGLFLFLEHVRAEQPRLARWQNRLERPWMFFGHGCHCNRDTLATIEASSLEVQGAARGTIPKAAPLVRPMISGSATSR